MGIFSGKLTKMIFKAGTLSISDASIQKLEEHYHSIAKLLNSSVDANNDIVLLKLRKNNR